MQSLYIRCQVVTGVFIAIILLSFVAALSDLSLITYIQEIAAGGPGDDARADRIDSRQAVIGMFQVTLNIGCVIAFLMWFYRAHKNLQAAGLRDLQYSPGWAVGGFFVPILNLWRPYQVMKEVWSGSEYISRTNRQASWKAIKPAPLVGLWWALFLIMGFVGRLSARLMLRADELGEILFAGWVTLASDLMDIPAALAALLLVRRITGLQEQALTPFKKGFQEQAAAPFQKK